MPWQKGKSGNPHGRKPNGNTAKDFFCKLGGKDGKAYAQQLHDLATGHHDDANARLKALAIIAPYVWGKPQEFVEHSGEITLPVRVVHEYHEKNAG